MKILKHNFFKNTFFLLFDKSLSFELYGIEINPKNNNAIQRELRQYELENNYSEIQLYQMAFSKEDSEILGDLNNMINARKVITNEKAKVFNEKISAVDFLLFMLQKEILQMKKELEEIL